MIEIEEQTTLAVTIATYRLTYAFYRILNDRQNVMNTAVRFLFALDAKQANMQNAHANKQINILMKFWTY